MNYTPQQQQAIHAGARNICVSAGAGSGKTRILVDRMVRLLDEGVPLDEIVAITFTEKAAAEMKDRLRRRFRERAPQEDSAELTKWRNLERELESARISTIHAFCINILRAHALRAGIDPDFAILSEAETGLIRNDLVSRTLHLLLEEQDPATVRLAVALRFDGLKRLLLSLLQQRSTVEPLLACFGNYSTEQLLTYWEQATLAEAERRLSRLRHSRRLRHFIKKLRSLDGCCDDDQEGRELLRRELIQALETISKSDNAAVVRRTLDEIINPAQKRKTGSSKPWGSTEKFKEVTKLQDKVKKFFSDCLMGYDVSPEVEARSAALTLDLYKTYAYVRQAFREEKTRDATADFDDLIQDTFRMLNEHEDVRTAVALGIRFLLMDEFQDTDPTQLELVKLLTSVPDGPALFLVGDAKQSIYNFRGADLSLFEAELATAEERINLHKNFRTVSTLLSFVNEFFETSGMLSAIASYEAMQPHRTSEAVTVELLVSDADEDNKEAYRKNEAKLIAARLVQLCSGDSALSIEEEENRSRAATFGDAAILLRDTGALATYEEELRKAGIPYIVVDGAGFYQRQEVVDFVSVLKVAADPWDEHALLAFLRGPVGQLDDNTITRMAMAGGLCHVFNGGGVLLPQAGTEALARCRILMRDLRSHATEPLCTFLARALNAAGLESILLSQFHGIQKAANVRKIVNLAEDFSRARPVSLRAFIAWLDEVRVAQSREAEAVLQSQAAGAVTIMTIHKSKGLEFPVVVIPDASKGFEGSPESRKSLLVHRQLGMALKVLDDDGCLKEPAFAGAIKNRKEEEEEAEHARLLYVAMTRARDYLIIAGAPAPSGKSWLESLDDQYDVLAKTDGTHIAGAKWRGIVRRRVLLGKVESGECDEVSEQPRQFWERRIQAITPMPVQSAISISKVLNLMADEMDIHEERNLAEETVPATAAAGLALERGALIHRFFELWDFTDDQANAHSLIELLLDSARLGLSRKPVMRNDLCKVAMTYMESPLRRLYTDNPPLRRELPFFLRADGWVISGTMDVLLADGSIVDYKTGRMDEKRNARYEFQLLLYAAALQQITGKRPPRCLLYYVDEDQLLEVKYGPDDLDGALRELHNVLRKVAANQEVSG